MGEEEVLQYFAFAHLKPELQEISRPFCDLAKGLCDPDCAWYVKPSRERTKALDRLLEAKDAAVRAKFAK